MHTKERFGADFPQTPHLAVESADVLTAPEKIITFVGHPAFRQPS
jgi:hypothetical protein